MFKDYRISQENLDVLWWNFKRIRQFMDLHQEDVANMMGFKQAYISLIENGKRPINRHLYLAIIRICEMYYRYEDPMYRDLIEDEFRKDFTYKRPKNKGKYYSLKELVELSNRKDS